MEFPGFGRSGQKTQLKEYIKKERIDIIFLQETMRQDFTDQDLRTLVEGEQFVWHWTPANGRSGGMLMGIRDSLFEVGALAQGEFFLSAKLYHRPTKFKCEFIGVYGLVDHSHSTSFLQELDGRVDNSQYPIMLMGDFNLIRGAHDKNNNNINWALVSLFNDAISRWALLRLHLD
jgi:exonuclease III